MKTPQEKKSSKNSRYVSLSAHSPYFIVNSFQFLTIKIQKKPQTKAFGLSLLKISIKVFFFFRFTMLQRTRNVLQDENVMNIHIISYILVELLHVFVVSRKL
jgi:hypothetical protein